MKSLSEELQGARRRLGYYARGAVREILPRPLFENRRGRLLTDMLDGEDAEILIGRANYYNKLNRGASVVPTTPIDQIDRSMSRYFFDLAQYLKFYPSALRIDYRYGDVTDVPITPEILKSRPVSCENRNSVLLNLDKLRHYKLVPDHRSWDEKLPKAVWRGRINNERRRALIRGFSDSAFCDVGHIGEAIEGIAPKGFLAPADQLAYRYIVSIEGNDVATNLKWIMASNSVCLMPAARFETWFMEGSLVPGHHFVQLKDDFSDLNEKIAMLEADPAMAREIVRNANRYVADFLKPRSEQLVSLLVLQKYFEATGQMPPSSFSSLFFPPQPVLAPERVSA